MIRNAQMLPKTLLAFLWHFVKPYKWYFLIFCTIPATVCIETSVMPYLLKRIINAADGSSTNDALKTLIPILIIYIGAWVLMLVLCRISEWQSANIIPRVQANIRLETMNYVMQHSHRYFAEHFAGSIANKVNDLARTAFDLFVWVNWTFTVALATVIVTTAIMYHVHPLFALIIWAWFSVTLIGAALFAKRVNRFSAINAEDRSMVTGKLVDVLSNMLNVRSFARREFENRYLRHMHETEVHSQINLRKQHVFSEIIVEIPIVAAFGVSAVLLIHGWSAGWITTAIFIYVISALTSTMFSLWRLGASMHNFFDYVGTCNQALSIIHKPIDILDKPGAQALTVTKGEITFENVHFHYIAGRDIFQDKNITIHAGEKVGLVGFSGSGKSTFVNLILRFYDVESGRICIDGQDIADVTQESLHNAIAVIPQDTSLFHRSLMENIRYGRPEATEEEVIAASKQAHCHEFIMQTEYGYDSLVGERGVKLSGGQRQRIAIARTILKQAPILILDEATSALDSVTEKYIQQSLEGLMQGRTTIIIAHRLSTLAHTDRILVFDKGQIIEEGTHNLLLSQNGHYSTLWNMQAGGFLPDKIEI